MASGLLTDSYNWNGSKDIGDDKYADLCRKLMHLCRKKLSGQVDKLLEEHPNLVNLRTTCGHTALLIACKERLDMAVIMTLIRHGFDPSITDIISGWSSIQYAVAKSSNYPKTLIYKLLVACPDYAVRSAFLKKTNNFGRKQLHTWSEKEIAKKLEKSKDFRLDAKKLLGLRTYNVRDLTDGEESDADDAEIPKKKQRV